MHFYETQKGGDQKGRKIAKIEAAKSRQWVLVPIVKCCILYFSYWDQ